MAKTTHNDFIIIFKYKKKKKNEEIIFLHYIFLSHGHYQISSKHDSDNLMQEEHKIMG